LLFLLFAIITVIYQTTKRINIKILYSSILLTVALYFFIDGIAMHVFKQSASPRPFAEQIEKDYRLSQEKVYVMNNLREYGNLYGMNFYMGNRFHNFEKERPASGYFLTTEKDAPKILERYGTKYAFTPIAKSARHGDIRGVAVLMRFEPQEN
jgi:hypothetical protein